MRRFIDFTAVQILGIEDRLREALRSTHLPMRNRRSRLIDAEEFHLVDALLFEDLDNVVLWRFHHCTSGSWLRLKPDGGLIFPGDELLQIPEVPGVLFHGRI